MWRSTTAAAILALLALGLSACTDQPSRHLQISATPDRTLADQPVHIRVGGAVAGSTVQVTATMIDQRKLKWTSEATFRAGATGNVDLDSTAPISGSYSGINGSGLLWSMFPPANAPADSFTYTNGIVTFTATSGQLSAVASIRRSVKAAGVTTRKLTMAHDGIDGLYADPGGAQAGPAVVVWGGSEGGLSTTADAEMLASHGIRALAIAYFGLPGLPKTLTNVPIEYFEKAVGWIGRQSGVQPNRVVVDGVSRGGEAALLTGLDDPAVAGVVSIVGSFAAVCGYPDGISTAWTLHGKPLACLRPDARADGPDAPTAIAVDKITGRLLIACGQDDGEWPSCEFEKDILDRRGKQPGDIMLSLAGIGHEIGSDWPYDDGNYAGPLELGGNITPAGSETAREQLWPAILAFITTIPALA